MTLQEWRAGGTFVVRGASVTIMKDRTFKCNCYVFTTILSEEQRAKGCPHIRALQQQGANLEEAAGVFPVKPPMPKAQPKRVPTTDATEITRGGYGRRRFTFDEE